MPPTLTLRIGGAAVEATPFVLADGSGPPRQPTALCTHATSSALIATFTCDDTDAWGTLTRHNDPLYTEECVELFLAPGEADPVDYFEFELSPLGTLFEARIHHPTGHRADMTTDMSWRCDGIEWNAGIVRSPGLWTADLTIPWTGLGYPDPEKLPRIWRLNFFRVDRPRDGSPAEFSCWSPTLKSPPNFHVPSHFGMLRLTSPASDPIDGE